MQDLVRVIDWPDDLFTHHSNVESTFAEFIRQVNILRCSHDGTHLSKWDALVRDALVVLGDHTRADVDADYLSGIRSERL
jgi:hypothetical protein